VEFFFFLIDWRGSGNNGDGGCKITHLTTRIPFKGEGYKVKDKHQNTENRLRMDYPLEASPIFRQEI
jgi:hypothetical protein